MGVDLLAAAEALLPTRPDLAAAVLLQVMEAAAAVADREEWLVAAGLAVAAGGGSGDGRTAALTVLSGIDRWGPAALTAPSARRLRVELALLAAGAGEPEMVRVLVGPVLDAEPEYRLHVAARIALARSATDPAASAAELRTAREQCADDVAGRALRAETVLVGAAIARHDGTPRVAVEAAEEGRRLISDGRAAAHDELRMSLVAESIAALLDVGDARKAREQAAVGAELLAGSQGPRRQRALLQLTVASALAATRETAVTVGAIAEAAQEAADSDAPDLEAICRSALGAIHEKAGRLDSALDEFRAGVDAQHRDRDREARFVAAVDALLDRETSAGGVQKVDPVPAAGAVQKAVEAQSASPVDHEGMSWLAGSAWGTPAEHGGAAEQADGGAADPTHADPAGPHPADAQLPAAGSADATPMPGRVERPSDAGSAELGRAAPLGRSSTASVSSMAPVWSGGAWSNGSRRNGEGSSDGDGDPAADTAGRTTRAAGHRTNGHRTEVIPVVGRTGARHAKPDTADQPSNGSDPAGSAGGVTAGRRRRAEPEPAASVQPESTNRVGGPAGGGRVSRPGRTPELVGSVAAGAESDRTGGRGASAEPRPDDSEISWPGLRWWAAGRPAAHPAGRDTDRTDEPDRRNRTGRRNATPGRIESDATDDGGESGRRRTATGETDAPDHDRSARSGEPAPDGSDGGGRPRMPPGPADADQERGAAPVDDDPLSPGWTGLRVLDPAEGGATDRTGPGTVDSESESDSDTATDTDRGTADGAAGRTADRGLDRAAGRVTDPGSDRGSDGATDRRADRDVDRAVDGDAGIDRGIDRGAVLDAVLDAERGAADRGTVLTADRPAEGAADPDPSTDVGTDPAAESVAEEPTAEPVVDSADVQAWMSTALDELDRVWGPITRRGTTAPGARLRPLPSEPQPVSSAPASAPRTPAPDQEETVREARSRSVAAALGAWAGGTPSGRSRRAAPDPAERAAASPMLPAPVAPVSKDALADLARRLTVAPERVPLPPPGAGDDAPDPEAPHDLPPDDAEPDPGAVGCAVVVDLARDSRRFAGLRAATVIREVAELVAEHVPAGSRLRFDEPHVLALVLPGWAGPESTRWMYRTLPRLLAGFTASEDIPGVQLRATVHDVDGPVGAQLLHRVDAARTAAGGRHGAVPGRSAFQPSEPESRPTRRKRGDGARSADQLGRAGAAAPATPTDRPERPATERRKLGAEQPAQQPRTADPAPFTPADADGLGLADLLAGALAAYRSI